jgi:hypothetical protein
VNAGTTCSEKTVTWAPNSGWQELWDGISTAGWTYTGAGSIARNAMNALGTAGGATATNTGVLRTTREFKDFHLQLQYRSAATSNNGGVIVRGGDQVAILDNGTAATRSGAIVGLAPTSSAQAKPTREWSTLDVIAYGNRITSRLNGVEVASHSGDRPASGPIGLENAGNNLMYMNVRVKELAADATAPTITVRNVPDGLVLLKGTPFIADYACNDEQDLVECSATPIDVNTPGRYTFKVTAKDAAGNETSVSRSYSVVAYTDAPGGAGATVPATLALTLGQPATFGAFAPGRPQVYTASTTATVVSTAGDAALTLIDPSPTAPGRLVNGTFALPQPLLAGGSPLPATLKTWAAPTSNEVLTVPVTQAIGAGDALRTGTYAKTLTFTVSTTTP